MQKGEEVILCCCEKLKTVTNSAKIVQNKHHIVTTDFRTLPFEVMKWSVEEATSKKPVKHTESLNYPQRSHLAAIIKAMLFL